jgi:hypothetical protein
MPETSVQDSLAERRHLFVLLRLDASRSGRLLGGELVDTETGPTARFLDWPGMTATVQQWLAGQFVPTSERPKRPPE